MLGSPTTAPTRLLARTTTWNFCSCLGRYPNSPALAVPELVQNYGKHLFQRFQVLYPEFFEGIDSALDLLPLVESYIHVEVRKLYPDAKLPTFDCIRTDDALELTYRSERPFADLAEGLIRACAETYHDTLQVQRIDLGDGTGTSARFVLSTHCSAQSPEPNELCPS